MMRFSRLSTFRNTLAEKLVHERLTGVGGMLSSHNFMSRVGISTGPYSGRTLGTNYTIFKGKAALSMKPQFESILPISPISLIEQSIDIKLDRKGVVMLSFWPAVGQRKYDWQKKQHFALSATEVGSLISLGPAESCVMNSNTRTNERFSVPVTKAEFAVMRTAFNFVLPKILGWDIIQGGCPVESIGQSLPRQSAFQQDIGPNRTREWEK
ncbi:hypothetical protein QJS10_CPA02g00796 [Acorus calamus]|uniref:Uncharacterized protein n=1 Tax=Acorus calamus TaxID=4465 RepID=A0AAV9FCK3_ACOCL|nr:hypothetical protein QJS10_CPA02g00796 [Acorus calamus]